MEKSILEILMYPWQIWNRLYQNRRYRSILLAGQEFGKKIGYDLKKDAEVKLVKAQSIYNEKKKDREYDKKSGFSKGVVRNIMESVGKEKKGSLCRVLPTSSDNPRSEHQLYVGKIDDCDYLINTVGITTDFGCQHGIEFLEE